MWNFDILREIREILFNFWPIVSKYSDLVTSRVENHFRKFRKLINGYKNSQRSVETKCLFEQYIFLLIQYWTVYLIYLFLTSNKEYIYFWKKV